MCFSAEASFAASAILAVTGVAALKNHFSSSYFFLAVIPFFFAIQQFSEGLIWLHLTHHFGSEALFINAQRSFLIFGFLIWPIWIPLSLALIEKIYWRRLLLFIILFSGLSLSLVNLYYGIKGDISVQITQHSLQYSGEYPSQTFLYPLIVLLPCFLSSVKNVWIFGILLIVAYFVASYFYTQTFVSVWCFFSAIVSLCIYKILKNPQIS